MFYTHWYPSPYPVPSIRCLPVCPKVNRFSAHSFLYHDMYRDMYRRSLISKSALYPRPYAMMSLQPKATNFVASDQEFDGIRFALGTPQDLNLILSAIPTADDRELLYEGVSSLQQVSSILEYNLRTTHNFVNTREGLKILAYLIYDKEAFVGFGALEFLEDHSRKFLEVLFTEEARKKYGKLFTEPHAISNIMVAIHPDYRGKGYGTRLESGLLDILYNQTNASAGLHSLVPRNKASAALALKLKFEEVPMQVDFTRVFLKVFDRGNTQTS